MRRRLLIVLLAALCACSPAAAATGSDAGDPLQAQEWWLPHIGADRRRRRGRACRSRSSTAASTRRSPEFAGRPNTTFLNDQTVDGPGEYHGTAVASLAVAPRERRRHRRRLSAGGVPELRREPGRAQITDFPPSQGIVAAAQHCPGVISISFGGRAGPDSSRTSILGAVHNGCLIVAAAGNGGLAGQPADVPRGLSARAHGRRNRPERRSRRLLDALARRSTSSAPGVDDGGSRPALARPERLSRRVSAGRASRRRSSAAAAAWVWTLRPTLDVTQIFQLAAAERARHRRAGLRLRVGLRHREHPGGARSHRRLPSDPDEPNDDVDQIKPGALFADGRPLLTTPAKPSIRISGRIDQAEDPRDLYRIWVPAHRVVRATRLGGRRRGRTHLGAANGRRRRGHPRAAARPEGTAHPRRQRGRRRLRRGAAHGPHDERRATCSSVTASKR